MSSSPNRASNSTGKSRRKEVTLDLGTARQMLPLVRSIVVDIRGHHQKLNQLNPEQDRLERNRHSLDWTERSRRYSIHDEIRLSEKNLANAVSELDALGVTLVNPDSGQVDFPTRINGRSAAFTWHFDEEAVGHWHYSGEPQRRPIPNDWQQGTPIRARSE